MHAPSRTIRPAVALLAALVFPFAAQAADPQTVYSNDFSTAADGFSSSSRSTSNGESFLGRFGRGTVSLSLADLAAHDSLVLNFDLYIIQTWDGNGPEGGAADYFSVEIDGTQVFYTSFAQYGGRNTQAYPNNAGALGDGGSFAPRTGAYAQNHLGYGSGDFGDSTYRISLTLDHIAPDATIRFTSLQNQGMSDESWGLDNVSVSVTTVPEPESWALLCAGLGLIGVAASRRRNLVRR
ncbi:MAG: PEP-CTERM sorting domain-containing protein [Methyloversatilis sp.]|nr:PEP-CTERM sorting domain-containing protein [Methyloversatilis sp.]